MSRSLIYLRRGLLCFALVASFSLSAAPASAGPWYTNCPATGYDYPYWLCAYGCDYSGYCRADGYCMCGDLP